ncbi:RNA polymerase III subunit Rpc25-domain-containing protein [Phlebopus sp. FC_14]|nr:RNA polymerase III subunit Rpc25-domain-containing protein [Phlebopus sp. FC_14]KAH7881935.1 RNA polymerase III subunit Rpc25-domain-containing protein [Phlebopus sp. FC_14]
MFVLSIIKDTIPVLPANFGLPPEQALINEINKKYANRVLHDVGLCISVFDLVEAGEGKVRYGDGCLWYKSKFRMVVFRPFASEVILAKVKSSDEDGMRLSVCFFDDMYIPQAYLPQPSAFDPNERAHFWLPDSPYTTAHELLESPTSDRMYIDQGEIVRVRVEVDEFYDDEPGPPKAADGVVVKREARKAPYSIICSIAEQGLGPTAWWKSAQPAEDLMDEG